MDDPYFGAAGGGVAGWAGAMPKGSTVGRGASKGAGAGAGAEAGAWDGVHLSNTLFLERERNWTGILIEPHAEAFRNLSKSGRRGSNNFIVNSCLSTEPMSQSVIFDAADVFSNIYKEGWEQSY